MVDKKLQILITNKGLVWARAVIVLVINLRICRGEWQATLAVVACAKKSETSLVAVGGHIWKFGALG